MIPLEFKKRRSIVCNSRITIMQGNQVGRGAVKKIRIFSINFMKKFIEIQISIFRNG